MVTCTEMRSLGGEIADFRTLHDGNETLSPVSYPLRRLNAGAHSAKGGAGVLKVCF